MNNTLISAIKQKRERFERVCAEYAPLTVSGPMWRYGREPRRSDPTQGWKIHVSATILSAANVLESVGTYLRGEDVLFKCVASLDELAKLNSGLHYGYAQIGKFITVYPETDDRFRMISGEIDRLLRSSYTCPSVPFERRFSPTSNVFYRYGSFVSNDENGTSPDLIGPSGQSCRDDRVGPNFKPEWIDDPLPIIPIGHTKTEASAPRSRFSVTRAISQRGKGGIYDAVDTSTSIPRACIVKEGRRNGETAWDGRDGEHRVKNETAVLIALANSNVHAPTVYDYFSLDGNFYTIIEKIEGITLEELVATEPRRLSLRKAIDLSIQIAEIGDAVHSADLAWRDCKPSNLILTPSGNVRPIDFEGACPASKKDPLIWSTPHFTPPEAFHLDRDSLSISNVSEDLYALGACVYFLLEGRYPERARGKSESDDGQLRGKKTLQNINFSRRGIPTRLRKCIECLMGTEPSNRPSAKRVAKELRLIKSHLPKKVGKANIIADRVE